MNNNFVIDASAWVEYFNGTDSGENVKEIVENHNNKIYTNLITIAELSSYFKRKNFDFREPKRIILGLSSIFTIDLEFAQMAGEEHAKIKQEIKNISLADIFVYLTAKKLSATIVTGDNDFRGLKNVFMIQ